LTTTDRVLGILRLFSIERPEWGVEEIARELELSQSTAYQYVRSLVEAGLIVGYKTGRYVVGPAVIELDRLTRRSDPFILAAQPTMARLSQAAAGRGMALLCRLYRRTVMCVDQRAEAPTRFAVSYERGRPMPLLRGSASKVILAHLPPRALKRFFEDEAQEIVRAGLGADWSTFRAHLRDIRQTPFHITRGELDPGLIGLSAPVFGPNEGVTGSIGLVLDNAMVGGDDVASLTAMVAEAGGSVTRALAAATAAA
jgi:DNA-binding IclR family transcriptional regulator